MTGFVTAIEEPALRADAEALIRLLGDVTGQRPVIWGKDIIGFGHYHYRYASKREGDWFRVGFAIRKSGPTIYLPGGAEQHKALLQGLGKYKTGKGCLYLKRFSDVDPFALRQLIEAALSWLDEYIAQAKAT